MGATSFEHTVKTKDPAGAFKALVEQDQYENGHSYSGGIGMKSFEGFVWVSRTPVTATQAKRLMDLFFSVDDYVAPKKGQRVNVSTYDSKRERFVELSGTVLAKVGERFRVQPDTPLWGDAPKPMLVPRYDVEVEREFPDWVHAVNDKWGPAGCIPVKGGKFIFFGMASS